MGDFPVFWTNSKTALSSFHETCDLFISIESCYLNFFGVFFYLINSVYDIQFVEFNCVAFYSLKIVVLCECMTFLLLVYLSSAHIISCWSNKFICKRRRTKRVKGISCAPETVLDEK